MSTYVDIKFKAVQRTVDALEQAALAEGLSKTDVLNRAVQLYAYYVEQRDAGSRLAQINPDGTVESLNLS